LAERGENGVDGGAVRGEGVDEHEAEAARGVQPRGEEARDGLGEDAGAPLRAGQQRLTASAFSMWHLIIFALSSGIPQARPCKLGWKEYRIILRTCGRPCRGGRGSEQAHTPSPSRAPRPSAWPAARTPPRRRVIENEHSNRDRSVTYLQGECSYIRADVEEEEEEIKLGSSGCSQ